MGKMLEGKRYRGDFEESLKKVVKEMEEFKGEVILIDEINKVIGEGEN